jgi:hypothetical protein
MGFLKEFSRCLVIGDRYEFNNLENQGLRASR